MRIFLVILAVQVFLAVVTAQDDRTPPPTPPPTQQPGSDRTLPPRPEKCFDSNNCVECEEKGGKCMENGLKCCFHERPHMECIALDVPCDSSCSQKGGVCKDDKCCFNKTVTERPPPMRCIPTNGICGDNCTGHGGQCMEGKCCFGPPRMHCMPTSGTCGMNCTRHRGKCMEGKCCFVPPPHERCIPMNGTCGSNCTQKGGNCKEGKCCFDPEPHARCFVVNGTCGTNCRQRGGECKEGKCCFDGRPDHDDSKEHDDDKSSNDDDDSRDDDDKTSNDDDDSSDDDDKTSNDDGSSRDDMSREHGDNKNPHKDGEYKEYNGMKFRCTKMLCNSAEEKNHCMERKGTCFEGKCCFKPTANPAQSRCEQERKRLLNAAQNRSGNTPVEHLNCSSNGAFLAKCQTRENRCHCLNATSGQPIGQSMRVQSKDRINCDKIQNQTKTALLNTTMKVSPRSFNSFMDKEINEIKRKIKVEIESLSKTKVRDIRAFEGSLMVEIQLGLCTENCSVTANTTDLYSIGLTLVEKIEQGGLMIEFQGETMVVSNPTITNITTVAALQAMEEELERTKKDEDELKTIVIVAVVAAVVAVIVSVAVACYCYSRANKAKTKAQREKAYFSDACVNGIDNAAYLKA